jgi:tyrosyl-tRNA synthetase
VPNREISISDLSGEGKSLLELLVLCGLCTSKGQARKDVDAGGIYLANIRENNIQRMVTAKDLMFGKYLLLRKGKRNYSVLKAIQ